MRARRNSPLRTNGGINIADPPVHRTLQQQLELPVLNGGPVERNSRCSRLAAPPFPSTLAPAVLPRTAAALVPIDDG